MRYVIPGGLALLVGAMIACGSDDAPASDPTDDGTAAPPEYTGAAKSSGIPYQDADPSFQPDPSAGDGSVPPLPCCKITFALPDATGNETTALLRGDVTPVDDTGIALTYAAGKWSATACITEQTYLRYRFYFGQVPELPGSSTLVDDNRTDPTPPIVDDGAGGSFNTFGPVASCSDIDAAVGP